MRRLDNLIRRRADERRQAAVARAASLVKAANERNIEISVVGSLIKNRFRIHSDVDLLVHGDMDAARRAIVERLVADHFRGTTIPYDLIFAADITPERLQELIDDSV